MLVQKKSLINNRKVTKKALIAKGAKPSNPGALKASAEDVHTLRVKQPAVRHTLFKSGA